VVRRRNKKGLHSIEMLIAKIDEVRPYLAIDGISLLCEENSHAPDHRFPSFSCHEFTRVRKEWTKPGFGWVSTVLGRAACDRFVHSKFFDDATQVRLICS